MLFVPVIRAGIDEELQKRGEESSLNSGQSVLRRGIMAIALATAVLPGDFGARVGTNHPG
jgi:hypothetical protein